HLRVDRARRRRHFALGPERRLPGSDRDRLVDIAPVHPVALVRREAHLQVQVARRPSADARPALPGQADVLALDDALGDGDLQGALLAHHPAVLVQPGAAQRDGARGTVIHVRQVDHHARMVVAATHAAGPGAAARGTAEEAGEELAELLGPQVVEGAARELEAGAPVRGRPELLAGASRLADLVVGGAFLGIGQHRIGLVHRAHARLGVRLLADVRVVLARELAVGLLD